MPPPPPPNDWRFKKSPCQIGLSVFGIKYVCNYWSSQCGSNVFFDQSDKFFRFLNASKWTTLVFEAAILPYRQKERIFEMPPSQPLIYIIKSLSFIYTKFPSLYHI